MLRLVFLLLALAAALGGCVSIAEESGRQLDEVGDVELTTVICASDPSTAPTCPASNTSEISSGGRYQLLMGYRLPVQSSPPETIEAQDVPLSLSRSASLTAELERLAPPAPEAAQRWVGYVSPPFEYRALQSEERATVVARILLLRAGDGGPFVAPFRYRTVVGFRHAEPDPGRPVQCGEELDETNREERTTCASSPGGDDVASDLSVATRDLGIVDGPTGSAPRGGTGSVPFTLAYAGATPSPSFALAATTTVPGGTAEPAVGAFGPARSGASVVPVTVNVPSSTPPGLYEVALTATHENGQTRRAGGLVTVTGAEPVDRAPPELAMRLRSRPRIERARHIGIVADASCSEPCRLSAQLRAGHRTARALRLEPGRRGFVVVGAVAERRAAAGRRNVRIRFHRGIGLRMLRLRRVSLTLSLTARDAAGNVRRRSLGFSLRR